MSVKIGVVMDPIARIAYSKDSTLAMLWAAADRGWSLFYMEPADLSLEQGAPRGNMAPLEVFRDPRRWFALGEATRRDPDAQGPALRQRVHLHHLYP